MNNPDEHLSFLDADSEMERANEIKENYAFPNHLGISFDDSTLEQLDYLAQSEDLQRGAVIRGLIHDRFTLDIGA